MRSYGYYIVRAAIILIASCAGFGAMYFTGEKDSPIEQAAESILKANGIDIDFSSNDNECLVCTDEEGK